MRIDDSRSIAGAHLEAIPVFANGPTGLVQLTVFCEGDRLTVQVDAEKLTKVCAAASGATQLDLFGASARPSTAVPTPGADTAGATA